MKIRNISSSDSLIQEGRNLIFQEQIHKKQFI